MVQQKLK